jgi:hypothetical protein
MHSTMPICTASPLYRVCYQSLRCLTSWGIRNVLLHVFYFTTSHISYEQCQHVHPRNCWVRKSTFLIILSCSPLNSIRSRSNAQTYYKLSKWHIITSTRRDGLANIPTNLRPRWPIRFHYLLSLSLHAPLNDDITALHTSVQGRHSPATDPLRTNQRQPS